MAVIRSPPIDTSEFIKMLIDLFYLLIKFFLGLSANIHVGVWIAVSEPVQHHLNIDGSDVIGHNLIIIGHNLAIFRTGIPLSLIRCFGLRQIRSSERGCHT